MTQCYVNGIIDVTGITEQTPHPFTEEDPGNIDYDTVTDPEVLLAGMRDRDASNPGLMALYMQATNSDSLGAGAWVAANLEDPDWWLAVIGAAGTSGATEDVARAIIETAALEFPDISDRFDELTEDPEPPTAEFIEWARTVADAAEPYGGPPAPDEDSWDPRVRVTDVEPSGPDGSG